MYFVFQSQSALCIQRQHLSSGRRRLLLKALATFSFICWQSGPRVCGIRWSQQRIPFSGKGAWSTLSSYVNSYSISKVTWRVHNSWQPECMCTHWVIFAAQNLLCTIHPYFSVWARCPISWCDSYDTHWAWVVHRRPFHFLYGSFPMCSSWPPSSLPGTFHLWGSW